jgi:hypothetical protein
MVSGPRAPTHHPHRLAPLGEQPPTALTRSRRARPPSSCAPGAHSPSPTPSPSTGKNSRPTARLSRRGPHDRPAGQHCATYSALGFVPTSTTEKGPAASVHAVMNRPGHRHPKKAAVTRLERLRSSGSRRPTGCSRLLAVRPSPRLPAPVLADPRISRGCAWAQVWLRADGRNATGCCAG